MKKRIKKDSEQVNVGDYFYGSSLRSGDEQARHVASQGGGWVKWSGRWYYVLFAGNGTREESDVWLCKESE